MLDIQWVKEALKEAIEEENWDLVREVIVFLSDYEEYGKQDDDWWSGAGDKD